MCNSTTKTPPPSPRSTLDRSPLHREHSPFHHRGPSTSSDEETKSNTVNCTITGIFCALKHWICKHFHVSSSIYPILKLADHHIIGHLTSYIMGFILCISQHFREDEKLAEKAETLIQHATDCQFMQTSEITLILETQRLYIMQQEEGGEERQELEILKCPQSLVRT